MLYYLIYVKKYENTFYNIVLAKLKIKTTSHAEILPHVRITVHALFFREKTGHREVWQRLKVRLTILTKSFLFGLW